MTHGDYIKQASSSAWGKQEVRHTKRFISVYAVSKIDCL